ncbi:MAG: SCO family protein [Gemmatimonadota bacterium]
MRLNRCAAVSRGVLAALFLGMSGCVRQKPSVPAAGFSGAELLPPRSKAEFTLTDMHGARFDFRKETDGHATLLFFGYTHCPDVCPVHMANIAAALHQMPPEKAKEVRVVFVTTDPDRDTPERLRSWLGGFDSTFIGLTGSAQQVADAQATLGLHAAQRDTAGGMAYGMNHGAMVLAYTTDDSLRVMYPMGVSRQSWIKDLPLLAASRGAR